MKVIWVDVETTGLDPVNCRIVELAILYEDLKFDSKDKEGKDVFHKYIKYDEYPDNYDEVAKIHGVTKEILEEKGKPEKEIYFEMIKFFDTYLNPFDKKDKAIIAGFRVGFDDGFLRELFKRYGDKYAYGCRFNNLSLDVASTVAMAIKNDKIPRLENHKLHIIADYFHIEIKAHSAISDIMATRQIQNKLEKLLNG